jgi:ubiquinone/menaquinone biosynthesis C-methylase UbiE
MRTVSGGIDYLGGYERGVRFGLQEIQGVTVDMDHAARDAVRQRLAFMDDALREMAQVSTPITWIHGRFDAWVDFERVKLLMGAGDTRCRRVIEVPTGHQLRSSVEAIEVFQLIASEVARLAGVGTVVRGVPSALHLKQRSEAERRRLPRPSYEPRKFWRDYLVGRDGHLGIELMTGTSAYESLMARQVAELKLESGQIVCDLGAGTGSFTRFIAGNLKDLALQVNELDFVVEAMRRSRSRLLASSSRSGVKAASVVCDLSLNNGTLIPLADDSQDAVLGSLLISYLPHPRRLLADALRILRPGGRLVVSSLRPDADTSRIYHEAVEELRCGRARALFGEIHEARLGESVQSFMNDAARLLDLEEQAVFRFFEEGELREMLEELGFEVFAAERAFGVPPQAALVSARKPLNASPATTTAS